ncbi:LytR/AlgR family response regulator transcription factor [Cellulophaga omnivescoria]|uniref:LytR/AlgR family response regulator transcription factor n=1 Tax=Cellulophaga omnivescoria TaxID=1888890 RepID=UPI000985F606|nr:LytTR family DNA-binding domain-containing protein [Cellulophaga omnivescoria]WBU89022.1 LytTR family DNA-binding domain-containing protein [Cellulophaga omnivescoria]WKB80996.1 LytTR family DNA-binding domain-containing protein [Cellulophaga lytica]
MYKCIIIDDEELARGLLTSYISKLNYLELVADYESPIDAIPTLKANTIDLIFLDIQMPNLKGTDFAKMIPDTTKIIFTTAYSEYALQGYELNALDYLLKPITFDRFLQAVNKLEAVKSITKDVANDSITIKSGYDLHKIQLQHITHIESDSEYVKFYLEDGKKIMSHQTLKSLEKTLNPNLFMRVHRSFIVNKTKVTSLKGRDLLLTNISIPVSDSYYDKVKQDLF